MVETNNNNVPFCLFQHLIIDNRTYFHPYYIILMNIFLIGVMYTCACQMASTVQG